jgi:arylsulfatase A-like enzyme
MKITVPLAFINGFNAIIIRSTFFLSFKVPSNNSEGENVVEKPNIIIVITDDQGKNDLGCEGNPYIKTPHLDNFYSDAIRFSNFHVSTTCAPTRGSIMTGRHTNRVNVFHTISGRSLLFEDERLLPQVLAENGYTNGMFGKWHLGDNYPFRPEDRGFHEVVRHGGGGVGQGPDFWNNDYFDDTYWHNGELEKYEGYCTDVFFSEAIEFIRESKDKPFFCYISTNAPHGPLNCPEKYLDLYEEMDEVPESLKRFYGMISNIDDNFKSLQDELKTLGIAENTILVFMTDNGTAGGQRIYDAGMTGGKGSVMEGGHRIPFYLQWPEGGLTGGSDIKELTAHYDLLPTFVDLLDLNFSPVKPLDGKSLVPLLKGDNEDWPNRILYMDTQRAQNLTKNKSYTVMDKDWRLVNGDQLYNVSNDLKQSNNVIDQNPETAARLAEGYERWWQSFVDEGVNERYAYIQVGSSNENPSRICSHDLLTGNLRNAWHQYGAVLGTPAAGRWKIEFLTEGKYNISLRRFPREVSLGINQAFPALKSERRLARAMPASVKTNFKEAFIYVGAVKKTEKIIEGAEEVNFTVNMPTGKFDFEAQLIDENNVIHPAYYVYIEKLD